MAFEGTLGSLSIPDLLQLIGSTRQTGTLLVSFGNSWKKVYFRDGTVLAMSSNEPDEFIGPVLVSLGKIREADLRDALACQQRESRLIGAILVERGLVTEPVLRRYLSDLAFEMTARITAWAAGVFRFEEFALPRRELVPLDLTVEQLLFEGLRRADELARLREAIPDEEVVIERSGDAAPDPGLDTTVVLNVLRNLDAPRSVGELRRQVKTSEFALLEGIATLLDRGLVRRSERVAPPPPPAPEWIGDARRLLMAGLPEKALELLRRGLAHAPDRGEARALLVEAEAQFVREVTRRDIPLDAVLEAPVLMEELRSRSLSPVEAFLVTRADGRADVEALLSMTPLPHSEILLALRRLVRSGYLRVRPAREPAGARG